MKKSLRGSVKTNVNGAAERAAAADTPPADVNAMINKYSGMSEAGLMRELISATGRQKAEGRFDRDQLDKNVQTLLPMLDEGQKRKLFEILGKL